jgi:hypothetical protein
MNAIAGNVIVKLAVLCTLKPGPPGGGGEVRQFAPDTPYARAPDRPHVYT